MSFVGAHVVWRRAPLALLLMLVLSPASASSNNDDDHGVDGPRGRRRAEEEDKYVVGGVETPVGRYPYHVAYVKNGVFLCGGSLVDERWVLTAAHCSTEGTEVYVGRHNLWFGSEGEEKIAIANAVRHPDYDGATFDNDYLLLELERPSRFDPVELDRGQVDLPAGADVTVVGWGKTSDGGSMSVALREAEIDVVDRNECRERYSGLGRVTRNMLCAARAGRDACAGDSGGALVVKGSSAKKDVQVGLVSWGAGCAHSKYPGVYARVRTAYDWIQQTITDRGTDHGDDFWDDDAEDGSTGEALATSDDDEYYESDANGLQNNGSNNNNNNNITSDVSVDEHEPQIGQNGANYDDLMQLFYQFVYVLIMLVLQQPVT